jgi:UPF0755 protein
MKIIKRAIFIIFVLVTIAFLSVAFWIYRDLRSPQTHNHSQEYIQIQRGTPPKEIVNKLESLGVIKRGWILLLYLKLTGKTSKLKAGDYRFSSPITPLEVVAKLEKGEERFLSFTVIEGWTRWDIAAKMAETPELKLKSKEEALALMNDTSKIKDIDPKAENLEGYLYPDTYNFPLDVTPKQMIDTMVEKFRRVWKPEWTNRANELNRTPREIVTLASLIETEAKLSEERPKISSVIYNRLRINMNLGIDSAIIYASKLAGKWKNDGKVYKSDLERKSPYNTRIYPGLPPGPVASTSSSSLQAALFPAQTNYLYYVREPSRNDGAHNFYDNARDFERGVKALRDWERERNAREAAQKRENQTQ